MFEKETMNDDGKNNGNFIGKNSHLFSNHHHQPHSYNNLCDVGSSSINNFVDHQYHVGPSVSDSSSLYRGFNMDDDLGLSMEFRNLGIGNSLPNDVVPSDYGRFGRDPNRVSFRDGNAAKFRPSFVEGFGCLDGFGKDNRMYRLSGESGSNFGDFVVQQNSLTNFPRVDEYYGNGDPFMRGNGFYGDRMSYNSSDYVGNGGRVSRMNEHFYDDEFITYIRSIYGAPLVEQLIMGGCKELMSPWTSSQNYGGHVLGKSGGVNSLGSSQLLHSKQAVSRRHVLYNAMLEKMRASEQRAAFSKKTRQPYTGVGINGSVGHDKYSSGRRKNVFDCYTMQKLENNGGVGSPVGSDSVFETMYGSFAEAEGNIYHMAKDQNGCRFLQKKFEDGSFEDVQTIFNEIIDHVVELMVNPFGNYLIQKLLDVCNEEQRMKIVHVVTKDQGELVRICLNTHGTRVVQKLIDSLKTRNQISVMIRALEPVFLDLIQDLNGNHVVQRCLQCLNSDDNKFIFDAAAQFCVEIATHRHGCCVLQRCIAHSNGDQRKKLIEKICSNGFTLAQDPFGNYVVQYIIELKIPSAAAQLISKFEGHYVHLSMQKFSSHVVEKCLKFIEESQARIVYELLSFPHFEQLLQDPYANYVVQSALEVTQGSVNKSLVAAVRPHSTLRTNPYCKKIFTRGLINN
ncbi:hypothetical protein RND81_01G170100 [Saponaria officinalis]|uniref:PUM-HD domain-containing protein n=1 Tax=Saponaria officinalis TaxID=3572 RepID=A0AAW1NG68_SAPOF